jgi:predicted RNase H-like HicB family nuclease
MAAGETRKETLALMAEAIELYLAGMREDADPIPEPSSVELVEARY